MFVVLLLFDVSKISFFIVLMPLDSLRILVEPPIFIVLMFLALLGLFVVPPPS